MDRTEAYFAFAGCAAASAVLTGLVRGYALRANLLDVANERSSHQGSVPRGGGLAIVLAFLGAVALLPLPSGPKLAFLLGGGAIAAVGFMDDRVGLSPAIRAAVHLVASVAGVLLTAGGAVGHGVVGVLLTAGCIVGVAWMVNLYNFMDGIDGLSGGQAVVMGLAFFGFAAAFGLGGETPTLGLALAGSSLGFLIWNWPPAKIFMGDVGSGFLGYAFGLLVVRSFLVAPVQGWMWVALLAPFLADTGVTLLRRVVAGERWYEAHRSHAFQHLTRRFGGHLPATGILLGSTALVGAPLALAAALAPSLAPVFALSAVGLLSVAAWKLGAGVSAPSPTRSES